MARNGGATIDIHAARVRDRNGLSYPLDTLVVTADGLYYARAIEGNDSFWYQERWVLPRQTLVVNRFAFHAHRNDACDWYIETDLTAVSDEGWRVRDGYLDIYVHEGARYEVEDAGELADAIASGDIPLADAIDALHALDRLCEALRANTCSGHALLRSIAPSLPESMLVRAPEGGAFVRRA